MLVTTLCFKKRLFCGVIIKGAKLTLKVITNQKSANLKKRNVYKDCVGLCIKVSLCKSIFFKNALEHII